MKNVRQRPQEDLPPIYAEGLDSVALTEAILANLPPASEGLEYDPANAPILRQRVFGATPSMFAARDQTLIDDASKFALSYNLAPRAAKEEKVPSEAEVKDDAVDIPLIQGGGLGAAYHAWTERSETLNSIADPEARKRATDLAESYLKRGEERVFEKNASL